MDTEQQNVDRWLDRAVSEFHTNPLCTQLIRRLAEEYPESFSVSAIRHLELAPHSAADRFITILLLQDGSLFNILLLQYRSLFERVSDPTETSRPRSLKLFRLLLSVDPSLDVKLARMLPDRSGLNHDDACRGPRAGRIIDILDQTSQGRRLLPVIGHLINSPDPSICATATLFVGRRLKSPDWAERQLQHPDNRVRANAVESIWGLDTSPARHLLDRCVQDASSRVAGNALVGLHMIGTPGILDDLNRMARDTKFEFRATAAWAMGRMLDPSFIPSLNDLMKDENSRIRKLALQALLSIRRTVTEEVPLPVLIEIQSKPVFTPKPLLQALVYKQSEPSPFRLNLDGSSFTTSAGR